MGQVICIVHKSPHNEEIGCEDCLIKACQDNLDNFGAYETTYYKLPDDQVKMLKCPYCDKATDEREWNEGSEECEVCGPMNGPECPICGAVFTDCTDDYPETIMVPIK